VPHAILSVRLDDALEAQLQAFAAAHDLSPSAAARELLRQVLTDAEPVTRGWLEGRTQAIAQVYSALADALAGLSREA
jgi:plasmid stability protein